MYNSWTKKNKYPPLTVDDNSRVDELFHKSKCRIEKCIRMVLLTYYKMKYSPECINSGYKEEKNNKIKGMSQ